MTTTSSDEALLFLLQSTCYCEGETACHCEVGRHLSSCGGRIVTLQHLRRPGSHSKADPGTNKMIEVTIPVSGGHTWNQEDKTRRWDCLLTLGCCWDEQKLCWLLLWEKFWEAAKISGTIYPPRQRIRRTRELRCETTASFRRTKEIRRETAASLRRMTSIRHEMTTSMR